MPTTNDDTLLHDTFSQRKSQVGTEIFESVEGLVPLKQSDVEPLDLDVAPHTVFRDLVN